MLCGECDKKMTENLMTVILQLYRCFRLMRHTPRKKTRLGESLAETLDETCGETVGETFRAKKSRRESRIGLYA